MFDDTNPEIVEQEVTEEIEAHSEEQPQQVMQKPGPSESFRQLREAKEKIERERDEAYRLLQQYQNQTNHQKSSEPDDDDLNIAPDEFAEGKHLSKVGRKVKKLEEQLKQYQQEQTMNTLQLRIHSQYPDFDNVVNESTIKALEAEHPEIAASIKTTPDMYNRCVSAYKLIKKLVHNDQPNYQEEKQLVQRNASKPRPLASMSPQQGDSPLSKANAFANGLTEELKKQLHAEMMNIRRNS